MRLDHKTFVTKHSQNEEVLLQNYSRHAFLFLQIAAASRIQGITPSAILTLLRHVKKQVAVGAS